MRPMLLPSGSWVKAIQNRNGIPKRIAIEGDGPIEVGDRDVDLADPAKAIVRLRDDVGHPPMLGRRRSVAMPSRRGVNLP